MADRVFTENGALVRVSDDGTVKMRTAEGLKMIFPPNPVSEPAPSREGLQLAGVQDRTDEEGGGDG